MGLGWLVAGGDFGLEQFQYCSWLGDFVFEKRTKHCIGNVAIFLLCAPLVYFLGFGVDGVIAALIASMVKHIEKLAVNL